MTLESQLVTILGPCCSGHVFNTAGADGETGDHVIFQRISSFPVVALQGEAPIENARFQIDCYSRTAAGASTLASSVKTAMAAAALINQRVNESAAFEDGVRLYRKVLEFSLWG